VDIYPTVLELTDQKISEDDQEQGLGKSLVPLLEGSRNQHHQYIYSQTEYSRTKPTFWAVRSQDWKFIETIHPDRSRRDFFEILQRLWREKIWLSALRNPGWLIKRYSGIPSRMLFDLKTDPQEEVNRYTEEHPQAKKLEAILKKFKHRCAEAGSRRISETLSADEDQALREHLQALGYLD
jgi:arylsulfatase A-like enzyme